MIRACLFDAPHRRGRQARWRTDGSNPHVQAGLQTTTGDAHDAASIALVDAMIAAGKPVAAVCHAPGVLRHARAPGGQPLVRGKNVTGSTNTEEEAAGQTEVVPFLVEDMLKEHGGQFFKAADWQPHVVVDSLLITGQNPASSEPAATALLAELRATQAKPCLLRMRTSAAGAGAWNAHGGADLRLCDDSSNSLGHGPPACVTMLCALPHRRSADARAKLRHRHLQDSPCQEQTIPPGGCGPRLVS